MRARDLQTAAAMVIGGGIGALVGWAVLPEHASLIACGVIGCALGQFTASRWQKRKHRPGGNDRTG